MAFTDAVGGSSMGNAGDKVLEKSAEDFSKSVDSVVGSNDKKMEAMVNKQESSSELANVQFAMNAQKEADEAIKNA